MRIGRIWNRLATPATPEWARLADHPPGSGPDLAYLRGVAGDQRRALDRFLLATAPGVLRGPAGLAGMALPAGSDWRWRPPVLAAPISPAGMVSPADGQYLGDSARLFHDCARRALSLRQIRNRRAEDAAAFALAIEVFGFTGSFLSLAIPLPAEGLAGLTRSHVLRVEIVLGIEQPVGAALRLNIESGPDSDRLQVPLEGLGTGRPNRCLGAFDLGESEIDDSRIANAWIDVLFIAPRMTAMVLRDMIVSRHPRAEI